MGSWEMIAINGAEENVQIEKEVFLDAVKREDKATNLKAVQGDGSLLSKIPARLRDEEICRAAVRKYAAAMNYVPARFRTKEMYEAAVICNPFHWMSSYYFWLVPVKYMTPEFYLEAIKFNNKNRVFVEYLFPKKWKGDLEELKQLREEFRKHPEVQLVEEFYEYCTSSTVARFNEGIRLDLQEGCPWHTVFEPGHFIKQNVYLPLSKNLDFVHFMDKDILLLEQIYSFVYERLVKSRYIYDPEIKAAMEDHPVF